MITYDFECEECGKKFEKFRFGITNLELWEKGKLEVGCPKCKSTDIKKVMSGGSGQFKAFKWR